MPISRHNLFFTPTFQLEWGFRKMENICLQEVIQINLKTAKKASVTNADKVIKEGTIFDLLLSILTPSQ